MNENSRELGRLCVKPFCSIAYGDHVCEALINLHLKDSAGTRGPRSEVKQISNQPLKAIFIDFPSKLDTVGLGKT